MGIVQLYEDFLEVNLHAWSFRLIICNNLNHEYARKLSRIATHYSSLDFVLKYLIFVNRQLLLNISLQHPFHSHLFRLPPLPSHCQDSLHSFSCSSFCCSFCHAHHHLHLMMADICSWPPLYERFLPLQNMLQLHMISIIGTSIDDKYVSNSQLISNHYESCIPRTSISNNCNRMRYVTAASLKAFHRFPYSLLN